MLGLWELNMIEEYHAYRSKEKIINELLERIAILERVIEEKDKVIEEVREYIEESKEGSLEVENEWAVCICSKLLEILDKENK